MRVADLPRVAVEVLEIRDEMGSGVDRAGQPESVSG